MRITGQSTGKIWADTTGHKWDECCFDDYSICWEDGSIETYVSSEIERKLCKCITPIRHTAGLSDDPYSKQEKEKSNEADALLVKIARYRRRFYTFPSEDLMSTVMGELYPNWLAFISKEY